MPKNNNFNFFTTGPASQKIEEANFSNGTQKLKVLPIITKYTNLKA